MRFVETFISLVYRTPGAGNVITNIKEHAWGISFRWHDDFDCAGVLQADGTVEDYAGIDSAQFDPINRIEHSENIIIVHANAETYCKQVMSDCLEI
jgi:hypothetical protein